jgi:hypothetical protein
VNLNQYKEVLFVRHVEMHPDGSALLPPEVAARITKQLHHEMPRTHDSQWEASFMARRARLILEQVPSLARLIRPTGFERYWDFVPAAVACVLIPLSLHMNRPSEPNHIHLLTPPMMAVVLFTYLYFLRMLGNSMPWPHFAVRWNWRRSAAAALEPIVSSAAAARRWFSRKWSAGRLGLASFSVNWVQASRPAWEPRLLRAFNYAAAVSGLLLLIDIYAAGWPAEIHVGWKSQWFDAEELEALIGLIYWPAALFEGLPGMQPFSAVELEKLHNWQSPDLHYGTRWVRLTTINLLLLVVLPRVFIAWSQGRRAQRVERNFPVDLEGIYYRSILQPEGQTEVVYLHYGPHHADDVKQHDSLRVLGTYLKRSVKPVAASAWPFGHTSNPILASLVSASPAGPAAVVVAFSAAGGPSEAIQGACLTNLRSVWPRDIFAVVDLSGLVLMFGDDPLGRQRANDVKDRWAELLDRYGASAVFVE